jgi:hypothetical protein
MGCTQVGQLDDLCPLASASAPKHLREEIQHKAWKEQSLGHLEAFESTVCRAHLATIPTKNRRKQPDCVQQADQIGFVGVYVRRLIRNQHGMLRDFPGMLPHLNHRTMAPIAGYGPAGYRLEARRNAEVRDAILDSIGPVVVAALTFGHLQDLHSRAQIAEHELRYAAEIEGGLLSLKIEKQNRLRHHRDRGKAKLGIDIPRLERRG